MRVCSSRPRLARAPRANVRQPIVSPGHHSHAVLPPAQKLEAKGYWPGEWLCADCGYIYEPGMEPAFEELRPGWKCPQCAGPRRRFVKKAGDMLGNLDDTPLYVGTGVAFVVVFGLVYLGLTV